MFAEKVAHEVLVVARGDGDEEDPDRHADGPHCTDDGVLPFTHAETHDTDDEGRRNRRYHSALDRRDRPSVNHLQPPRDSQAGEDAVSDGAGDVGDAPHHHVGSDHPTGDPGQGPRHQRVPEELELENGVDELHQ